MFSYRNLEFLKSMTKPYTHTKIAHSKNSLTSAIDAMTNMTMMMALVGAGGGDDENDAGDGDGDDDDYR